MSDNPLVKMAEAIRGLGESSPRQNAVLVDLQAEPSFATAGCPCCGDTVIVVVRGSSLQLEPFSLERVAELMGDEPAKDDPNVMGFPVKIVDWIEPNRLALVDEKRGRVAVIDNIAATEGGSR
jgi:hypothetical protein